MDAVFTYHLPHLLAQHNRVPSERPIVAYLVWRQRYKKSQTAHRRAPESVSAMRCALWKLDNRFE